MMRIYAYFKLLLLSALIVLAFSVLFYESTKDDLIDYSHSGLTGLIGAYNVFKDLILFDPYARETDSKIENFTNDFIGTFKSAVTNVTAITKDRNFYDCIYLYIMTKKMTGMDELTGRYFAGLNSFRDFYIIDSNNNILYKRSSNNLVPVYLGFHDHVNVYFTNDDLIIGLKYENPLDMDIEAAAVYDTGLILKKIKETDFETFFFTDEKIYKNSDFNTDFIKDSLQEIKTGKKFTHDNKTFETFQINISGAYIGTLGIVYPVRSFGDIFILILKALMFILFVCGIVMADRYISVWIKNRKVNAKAVRKKEAEALVNEENEKNLHWLEDYVKKSEDKNEM